METTPQDRASDNERDAHGETQDARHARLDRESAALRSQHPESLSSRILSLLAGFEVHHVHTSRNRAHPPERAMCRAGGALAKMMALALEHRAGGYCDSSIALELDDHDVVLALAALSSYLEHGADLILDIRDVCPDGDKVDA